MSSERVVVPAQDQISIYATGLGHICIVQNDGLGSESRIEVAPENIARLCAAIELEAKKLAEGGE